MTRWDGALLVSILLVGVFLLGAGVMYEESSDVGTMVRVETPSSSYLIDPNDGGRTGVQGALGEMTLEVSNGAVRVIDSPCPNQRCVHMGSVTGGSGAIVCVPGGVVIEPAGSQVGGLDDVVR